MIDHPYSSWVNQSNIKEIDGLLEKYADLPTSNIEGLNYIAMKGVQKEWETMLSDTLFRVTGFSQFFGALAFQCIYKWTLDLDTAGAMVKDGKFYIFMNPLFMLNYLKKGDYQAFVVVHEVFHIFYEHGPRGVEASYDPQIFNKACDYYLHNMMEDMINASNKAVSNVTLLPKEVFPICYDTKYRGMTEDEIYRQIEQKEKKKQKQQGGGSGQGDEDGDQNGSSGNEEGDDGDNQGSGQGGQRGFDQPTQVGQSESGNSSTNRQAVATAVRAAAVQASQCKSISDAELGIIRNFLEVTEPTVNWRDEFADFFERTRDDRPTYSRYSRRSTDEVIFPEKEGERIRLYFGSDSSGSMSDGEIGEAMSELQGVLDQIDTWEVTVATCDTRAYEICRLYSEEDDDLSEVTIRGGGGTKMSPMVEEMQLEWEDPYQVGVIFTDGELMPGDITDVYDYEIPLVVVISSKGSVPGWVVDAGIRVIQIND